MTENSFFTMLGDYAPSTILVAFIVTVGMYLLKKTVLKKYSSSALVTLLPFLLGVVGMAIAECLSKLSFECFLNETQVIFQQGFTAGCISVVAQALVDKLTGKTTLSGNALLASKLLQGFVSDEDVEELAKQVAFAFENSEEGQEKENIYTAITTFQTNKGQEVQKEEDQLLANLIYNTLSRTRSAK